SDRPARVAWRRRGKTPEAPDLLLGCASQLFASDKAVKTDTPPGQRPSPRHSALEVGVHGLNYRNSARNPMSRQCAECRIRTHGRIRTLPRFERVGARGLCENGRWPTQTDRSL